MKRLPKFLLILTLIVFMLACNFVTQPINDVQNLAGTAEALASAMPLETLQAIASTVPLETFAAIPSVFPELGDLFNPQGTPLTEWNGIPIMPEAVAAEEIEGVYSFKASATNEQAMEFYTTQIPSLGWVEQFAQPGDTALLFYIKDQQSLAITISPALEEGFVVIWLALS